MRKFILLAASALTMTVAAQAQNFKESLQKTFTAFDTTQDVKIKQEQSNKIALIAKRWPDEWAGHYYNAYSKVILSYMEEDEAKRDAWLEEAEKEHDEVVSLLKKDNDETYVLAALIANGRMAVKPMARWQKYGKLFEENLKQAKELNANNPRIYHLQGTSKFFTPKAFGGGKKAALPYFEKAEGLFANEKDDDITKIYWGKRANGYFIAQAKGEDKE
jgi:hypothetical protein